MNIWPKNTLEHWIWKAKRGELVKIVVSAEKEDLYRFVELLTVRGYELYRCFYIQGGEEKAVIRKPSVSGGGYGPVVTGGQILSGVESKSAVGITSLAEGLTCLVGVITYILISKNPLDWKLAPFIIVGAIFSVPFSVISVKKISIKKLKLAIAALTIVLGLFTIIKTLKSL